LAFRAWWLAQGPARSKGDPQGRRASLLPATLLPDCNPIEQVFSKLKRALRKADKQSLDALWPAIGQILKTFSPQECANYFKAAGYAST
jgi:transposase